jgi:hypothetical protein
VEATIPRSHQDYNRAVRPLSRLGGQLDSKPSSFDRLARSTAATRRNLEKLDPPDGARDEFHAMLARLDSVVSDLRRVARTARGHDVVKQRRAARGAGAVEHCGGAAETRLKQAVQG